MRTRIKRVSVEVRLYDAYRELGKTRVQSAMSRDLVAMRVSI